MKAFIAILLVLVQVATSFSFATCTPASDFTGRKSCCCKQACACAAGKCCVGKSDRPAEPQPAVPSLPTTERDQVSLPLAGELLLPLQPAAALAFPPASSAASCAAAVPVFCRDCSFLI